MPSLVDQHVHPVVLGVVIDPLPERLTCPHDQIIVGDADEGQLLHRRCPLAEVVVVVLSTKSTLLFTHPSPPKKTKTNITCKVLLGRGTHDPEDPPGLYFLGSGSRPCVRLPAIFANSEQRASTDH